MNFLIELINNVALLITLGLLYDISSRRETENQLSPMPLVFGLGIGLISIVLMSTPAKFSPGIIFDTRTILLCVTGLYFGPLTTVIAMLVAIAYRYHIGGIGTIAGAATIITSGTIGILWNRYRYREDKLYSLKELYLFGFTVHAVMLLCMFLLPAEVIQKTLKVLVIPAIFIYPLGTMLLGYLLGVRKKHFLTEKKLQLVSRREQELADIVRNAPVGIATGYPDGTLEICNANFSEMTGYSTAELETVRWNDMLTPGKWRALEEEELKRLNPQKRIVQYEKEFLCKDGKILPVEMTVSGGFDSNGKPTYYFAFAQDITTRKMAERKDKANQQQLITILNSIDANVYVADLESYEILFMNNNMIQDFGQDLTGEICWKVFRGESGPCPACKNDLLVDENGQPTDGSVWDNQNPITGKYYINHDRAIEWLDGQLVHLQISTDISHIKSMEEQLRQKYKMEAIGVMAGGMAHNFNNNLSVILGNLELAKMKLTGASEIDELLDHAKIAVLRSRDLIKQIMTYSRKEEKDKTALQLAVTIEEVMLLLKSTIPSSVYIQQKLSPASITQTIHANATQIQEILLNLCNNAVHAMDEQGTLTIGLDTVELDRRQIPANSLGQPGSYLHLWVQDTGCGIASDLLDKIFDPFFTTKALHEGTGMGLSTVQGIMRHLHGVTRVESQIGEGTTVHLYFPVTEQNEGKQVGTIDIEPFKGKESVLFVDDDEMIASMAQSALSGMGYQVTTLTDSHEALKLFTDDPGRFDLVITDQTMPEMTGRDLILQLKQVRSDIPTIICTGYSSKVDEAEAEKLGADIFLMKPMELPELLKTVRQVLDKK
ncbi:PAS domain S-box-containing protein [Malonomonas rubra DSM 5091]|uniref:histidine kinase n=1 Tax=Malonomonas rubra DSM 5091 TaxID=1122189 RepID=A0A1M6GFR3_MALRU|nr:LytS/YhcK type 5TM receptor domain-containing protein [Malonomonas rubra]SHJ08790.1 PAS domain S-box-containing protein [Malonomonas rubra DSM 5091]